MDKQSVVTDLPAAQPELTCTCAVPIPEVRATGRARRGPYCSRCDLPVRMDFAAR